MGFRLQASNKSLEDFHFGAFSWSWLLETGVGLAVGVSKGVKPYEFIYQPDKKGRCARYNDGYHVTKKQADMMAFLTKMLVLNQRFFNDEFRKLSDDDKEYYSKNYQIYDIRDDFIEKAEAFAEWAEKSKGFRIY